MADNGIAIMLTNDRTLWSPSARVSNNDRAFHINEGVMLTGVLRWATDLYPGNTHELAGSYPVQRNDYSKLAGIRVGGRQKADENTPSAG